MRYVLITVVLCFLLIGCEQKPDDPDNAVVSGYIYKYAEPTDSVFVDTAWHYVDWIFSEPVEGAQVWVEGDINSSNPYVGPDIDGFSDSTGFYSIPVFLGKRVKSEAITGFEYVYYVDARVFIVYEKLMYDFGGGITLSRGREFRLFSTGLNWFKIMSGQ